MRHFAFCQQLLLIKLLIVIFGFTALFGCVTQSPENPPSTSQAISTKYKKPSVSKKNERTTTNKHLNHKSKNCLALAMYWEARGEGDRGMLAVGSVILNRVENRQFPNSVCEVVYEGGETPPCQFSWWCDGKSDRPTNQKQWHSALNMADKLLSNQLHDTTGGALFFHSASIKSSFHRKRQRTARIGNHIFYR